MHRFRPDEAGITPEEMRAVVRLHGRLGTEATSEGATTVADVAEALQTTPEEVERLLVQIRQADARPVVQETNVGRLAAMLLAAVLLIAFVGSIAVGIAGSNRAASTRASVEYHVTIDDVGASMTQGGPLTTSETLTYLDHMVRSQGAPQAISEAEAGRGLRAIEAGRWESVPGISIHDVLIRAPGPSGNLVRLAGAKLPFYKGDDLATDAAALRERRRRLDEAIRKAASTRVPSPEAPR